MKIPNPFSKPTTQTNLTSGEDGSAVSKTSQQSTSVQSTPKVDQQIEALVPGQTLQGEVVAKNGKDITLKLAGDMVLTARLERELNLELGKLLTFQVKNNGKVLSLSPLFANMAMERTAHKALEMANIPISERNVEMATSMMERGMPVDVNSIQNVYKDVVTYGNASVEHILRLHQMEIPVTADNLFQLMSYENMEHQMALGMGQVVDDLQAEGIDQPLLGQILGVLGDGTETSLPLNQILTSQELLYLADSISHLATNLDGQSAILNFLQSPMNSNLTVQDMLLFLSQMETHMGGNAQEAGTQRGQLPLVEGVAEGVQGSQYALNTEGNSAATQTVSVPNSNGTNLPLEIATNVKELLSGETFGKLLNAHLQSNWMLEPSQVADKQQVMDVYERIYRQLDGLKQVLESAKGEESAALKSTSNLQNNINFMNQLNQLYTYIQIPLNLNGRNTHGELYVYTNKKNLAKSDGTVSALLHLDMEHLGPVDVYVAMQNQKVSTNFYLATDELLDFIHEHIYILDEHLAKRGYSLTCKMMQRDEEQQGINVIEEIAKEDPEKVVLSQYAFDVRA